MNFEEIGELIPVVNSVCKNVKDLVPIVDTISKSRGWLKKKGNNKSLEEDLLKTTASIKKLEHYISNNLPKLIQLIKDYSRLLADVRVARSISDKAAEIIGIMPELAPQYMPIFLSQIQSDISRVETGAYQLLPTDSNEFGKLIQNISVIRDLSRDLKKEVNSANPLFFKNLLDNISTYYADIEPLLSKLLDKILTLFDSAEE